MKSYHKTVCAGLELSLLALRSRSCDLIYAQRIRGERLPNGDGPLKASAPRAKKIARRHACSILRGSVKMSTPDMQMSGYGSCDHMGVAQQKRV